MGWFLPQAGEFTCFHTGFWTAPVETVGQGPLQLWVSWKPSMLHLCILSAKAEPQLPFSRFPHDSTVAAGCPACKKEALGGRGLFLCAWGQSWVLLLFPCIQSWHHSIRTGLWRSQSDTLWALWAQQMKTAQLLIQKTLDGRSQVFPLQDLLFFFRCWG